MERCPNCGNKLSNIDVLCPRCGTVVEVIQIKNNIASDATKSIAAADKSVEKKDFSQSFIVYNEDFPTDDERRETHGTESVSGPVDEAGSFESPPGEVGSIAGQSILDRYKQQLGESETATGEEAAADAAEENDNDYSSRYLENIMNINLPEIDDLQDFDPDEFMREYRRGKSASGEDAAPSKRWLEIEEADASYMAQAAPAVAAETIVGRRYRGTAARVRETHAARVKETQAEKRQEESTAKPVKLKPKKSNAMLSVLLWVLVAGAFFFSFIFFDKYVQRAYGTYDNLIYSITNGKVDLGPHN